MEDLQGKTFQRQRRNLCQAERWILHSYPYQQKPIQKKLVFMAVTYIDALKVVTIRDFYNGLSIIKTAGALFLLMIKYS